MTLALAGRRVLVTRALHQAGKLSDGLRALGATAVEVPVLEIQPPASYLPLDAALAALETYDWLILTSANTVQALAGRAAALGLDLAATAPAGIAAVGQATAAAAKNVGLKVTLTPECYVAESLLEALKGHVSGQRFLLARAAVARDVIPDALRAASAWVDVVDAYRNAMPQAAPAELRRALADGLDVATFTSSSSVVHLRDAAAAARLSWPFAGVRAVSIGPVTSCTLRDLGWAPAAEAAISDIPGLIAALQKLFD